MSIEECNELPVENNTWKVAVKSYRDILFEIWDDGDIAICFNNNNDDVDVLVHVDDLAEIVRRAKMFKDRRTAYLERKNNDDNA